MASRGIWRIMGARTRRSLTLSWTALFVLSLLLQYMTFAVTPVLAVHETGLFELDGNATNDAAVVGDDWNSHPGATGNRFTFIDDLYNSASDIGYTGGGSKDDLNTTSWQWEKSTVTPDKDDIEHAYAASYEKDGHTYVYFGLDKLAVNGDSNVGFWFFKNGIDFTGGPTSGGFAPAHSIGDLLVLSQFTNGGVVSTIDLYEWVGSGGSDGTVDKIASGNVCTGSPAVDKACAVANTTDVASPWAYHPKAGTDNIFPTASFFEGGIDLDALFAPGNAPCFSGFLADTRTSQSVDAVLKDVAVGNFNTCVPPTIATDASVSTWHFGDAGVTDTATLSGNDGPASGSVKFFVCTPAQLPCDNGGTQVGGSVNVTTSANGGTATSAAYTPTAAGKYCFRAEYTPNAASQYLAGQHTNNSSECVTVVKNDTSIVTTANESVAVGNAISDSATLSGATSDAGGTIVFKAYGPSDDNCNGTAAFTSAALPVSGNGSYGPVSFTPATAGTYHWIATYNGDVKNAGSAGVCGASGENDTVTKVSPRISTQASAAVLVGGQISDTATVSGGLNPTGTVTFNLYGPTDPTCLGNPIFTSANRALSGGTATSTAFTTTAVGTYHWIATYNGNANNDPVSGTCGDANESVVVSPAQPSISTSLHGDNKVGASITVPLGTAVHDTSTLTNATANAGGTVHYRVYTNATCQTLLTDAGTIAVVNGVPGASDPYTFNQAGTYYWQADYSGDVNNDSATSACNLEVVTVDKDIPSISTEASASVAVGGSIHDTATLSGTFNGTGTITFKLYGPGNDTCTGVAIFTTARTVSGSGSYTSADYTATTAGTYRWVASYGGDINNGAVSGGCNDANENVVVTKKSPTVVTQASASVKVGGSISDQATLAGGYNPTGSITFNLYGPDNATCTGTPIFTATVPVSGNGIYNSGSFATTAGGTYRWIANYSGDANNDATANACNGANENVVVTNQSPTVVTQASASVQVGGSISDQATLAGGYNPTGSITFNLYGPDNATCTGTPIFTATIPVSGNGIYNSGTFATTAAGTYRWIANYGGDANNDATANACNGANENVIVSKKAPSIATLATVGGQVGDLISDTATVSGGFQPTGTVTFKLFGPADPNCDGSALFTDDVALGQNGTATSGAYKVLVDGNYHWVASYSGDANNDSATGACGDEGETTTINKFAPVIATILHAGNLAGAKITVVFGSSVTDQATLTGASATAGGTVTYTVYTDATCQTLFADAGSKAVTNGVVPASNDVSFPNAGTYYWQASYGGDAANAPALSACTDEVLTVTTPNLDAEKLVKTNDGEFGPTSTAKPGDTLTYQITIANSGNATAVNVPASDDISAILAHATYNDDCSNGCSFAGDTLTWTIPSIAAGGSVTLTFSVTLDASFPQGTTHLPNVVIVTGPGSNCAEGSEDADCDTDTVVDAQPNLDVEKLVAVNDGAFAHSGSAHPGDTLTYQITIGNSGDAPATSVPVSDDISAILAHATYNDDCSNGCSQVGDTLTWTIPSIAAGSSITLTFSVTLDDAFPTGTTDLPNVAVVTGPGSNCAAQSEDAACVTDTTVSQSSLVIDKALTSGNTGGTDPILNLPAAKIGDTLTYTLHYTGGGPLTHAVITDVIPDGLEFVADSAHANADFGAGSYDTTTRTITWDASAEGGALPDPADGTLAYQVKVLATAPEFAQPLENTATIDSAETEPESDTAQVVVVAPPLGATATPHITLPPTDTFMPEKSASNPGFNLMLILLGLAGLAVTIGFMTPVPERVRRRDRQG